MKFDKELEYKIKEKYMSRKNWKRVLEKEYFYKEITVPNMEIFLKNGKGVLSVIKFIKLTEPFKGQFFNKDTTIVGEGYYWFQIGIENENFWITALFDSKKELFQIYIDITKENIIIGKDSYYLDLFLDIIIIDDNIILKDEDELEIVRKKGIISEKEYLIAIETKNKILNFLKEKDNLNLFKSYLIEEFSKITKENRI